MQKSLLELLVESDLSRADLNDIITQVAAGKAPVVLASGLFAVVSSDILLKHSRFKSLMENDNMGHEERKALLDIVIERLNAHMFGCELVFAKYAKLGASVAALRVTLVHSLNAMKNHNFCLVSENLQ